MWHLRLGRGVAMNSWRQKRACIHWLGVSTPPTTSASELRNAECASWDVCWLEAERKTTGSMQHPQNNARAPPIPPHHVLLRRPLHLLNGLQVII
jgi:hypothetical protein